MEIKTLINEQDLTSKIEEVANFCTYCFTNTIIVCLVSV